MADTRFTNREITAMFHNIDEKLDSHAETHAKILDQVLYTNGRVRRLYVYLTVVGTAAGTAVLMGGGGNVLKFIISIL